MEGRTCAMNDSDSAPIGPRESSGPIATERGPGGWLVLAGDAEVKVAIDTSSAIPLAGGCYGAWLRVVPVAVPAQPDLPVPRWCEEELVVFDGAGRRIGFPEGLLGGSITALIIFSAFFGLPRRIAQPTVTRTRCTALFP